MTPRMIEQLQEAHAKIGYYIITKNDRTGSFRVERVDRVGVTLKSKEVVIDLLTQNNNGLRYSAYSHIFETMKEAEEAVQRLTEMKRKETEEAA